jgi:hypothetical protein
MRLLPILLLAACSSPVQRHPVIDALESKPAAAPPGLAQGLLAASLLPDVDANVRYLMPRGSGCSGVVRPHPILRAGVPTDFTPNDRAHGPVVGQEFRVVFWTSAMAKTLPAPPLETLTPVWPNATPVVGPEACWIIVGHDETWTPRPIAAWPGCWQMVDPDAVIPVGIAAGWQGAVRREPDSSSRIDLRWTPSADMVGARVQLQLMTFAEGQTPHGFDLSHGVELTVGTR